MQVGKRGVITLPKELRENNNIADGDPINLFELPDGVIVMSKKHSKVDEMAKDFQESGKHWNLCK